MSTYAGSMASIPYDSFILLICEGGTTHIDALQESKQGIMGVPDNSRRTNFKPSCKAAYRSRKSALPPCCCYHMKHRMRIQKCRAPLVTSGNETRFMRP